MRSARAIWQSRKWGYALQGSHSIIITGAGRMHKGFFLAASRGHFLRNLTLNLSVTTVGTLLTNKASDK
jgi:hypothetical protein